MRRRKLERFVEACHTQYHQVVGNVPVGCHRNDHTEMTVTDRLRKLNAVFEDMKGEVGRVK